MAGDGPRLPRRGRPPDPIKTNQQVKAADRDQSNDFSSEEATRIGSRRPGHLRQRTWNEDVRDCPEISASIRTCCRRRWRFRSSPTTATSSTPKGPRFSTAAISRA